MEYYQATQTRAAQTVAVINQAIPALANGGVTAAEILTKSQALNTLAQTRDNALADYDVANNPENQCFPAISALSLSLPKSAGGDLDEANDTEFDLLELLSPAYAIKPRTTESALERGKKVVSALTKINAYLGGKTPALPPVTSGGKGAAQLTAAMAAQPGMQQAVEDRAVDVATARTDLRVAATALDRLNKRFHSKLQSEARWNPALAAALSQIETEGADLPGTLGIRSLLQGGTDNDFTQSVPVDPSGNALGPFAVGQTAKLRTRASNANGTTTGSIRTLTISAS